MSPVAGHFVAADLGLGLALLPVPFARAKGLVRVLPQEFVTMNIWLLRRRESDLRKSNREVRRSLEVEFANSKAWLAGEHRVSRTAKRKT